MMENVSAKKGGLAQDAMKNCFIQVFFHFQPIVLKMMHTSHLVECNCHREGTMECDKSEKCRCKIGWTGSRCQTNVPTPPRKCSYQLYVTASVVFLILCIPTAPKCDPKGTRYLMPSGKCVCINVWYGATCDKSRFQFTITRL